MKPHLYHLHAITALHCGTGQSAGIVDLPIARDRATNLPLVPGSSLRGVLRDDFASRDPALEKTLFGPRSISGAEEAHAGALAVSDAHLLLLPIRALAGIVAYATCPFILKRYAHDHLGATGETPPAVPAPTDDVAFHAADNTNRLDGKIVLEEIDLTPRHAPQADSWAETIAQTLYPDDAEARRDMITRFLVLPDSVFSFLAETATEIRARIAIDDKTGTVKKGALWYEENLPAETVLWGVYALSASRVRGENLSADELAARIPAKILLQLGGKAGVGRGLTRFIAGGRP